MIRMSFFTLTFLGIILFLTAPVSAAPLRSETGRCLRVDLSSGEPGNWHNVRASACDNDADQQFTAEDDRIVSDATGKSWCLDINWSAPTGPGGRGRNVILYPICHGGTNQLWDVKGQIVKSRASSNGQNWCLAIDPEDGNVYADNRCDRSAAQTWSDLCTESDRPTGNPSSQFCIDERPSVWYTVPHPVDRSVSDIHLAALASANVMYELVAPGQRAPHVGACSRQVQQRLFGFDSNVRCDERVRYTADEISYFVASNDELVILAFRGNNSDLPANESMIYGGGAAVIANVGFPEETTHGGIARAVNAVYPDIISLLGIHGAFTPNKKVIFTGHSMGGMLMGYTMYRLMRDNSPAVVASTFVTFGSPRYAGKPCTQDQGIFKGRWDEMVRRHGVTAYSVEIASDDKIQLWANGAATCVDRIGTPITYLAGEAVRTVSDVDRASRHRPEIYYDIAYRRSAIRPVADTVWEVYNGGAYPFEMTVFYSIPKPPTVPQPGARSLRVSAFPLGQSRYYQLPAAALDITVEVKNKAAGRGEQVFFQSYSSAGQVSCLKAWGSVLTPGFGPC